jgi:iron complex outermembrane receptor protein
MLGISQLERLFLVPMVLILTYSNFGHVDTYGFDLGFYYFDDAFRTSINYSYFGRDLDTNDLSNDGNKDGKSARNGFANQYANAQNERGLHYNKGKFYGAVYGRYVQKYDFFSGSILLQKHRT